MDDPAVSTGRLVETFGTTPAIDGVDLEIPPGGVHGFLGPNGRGKTTTIRVLRSCDRTPDAP